MPILLNYHRVFDVFDLLNQSRRSGNKMKKVVFVVLSVFLISFSIFAINLVWFRPFFVDMFYEKVFIEFVLESPQTMSSLGLPGAGLVNDELDDYSRGGEDKAFENVKQALAALLEYDVGSMTDEQARSRKILIWFLTNTIEARKFRNHSYRITQRSGVQQSLTDFMINIHEVDDANDLEGYVDRLNQFDRVFSEIMESLLVAEKQGIVQPRFMIVKMLDAMTTFTQTPIYENPLYLDFENKLASVGDLSDTDQNAFRDQFANAMRNSVFPAYQTYIDHLVQLQEVSNNDDGVWKFPNGDAYYQYRIKSNTTTDYSAGYLHEVGLAEVSRIDLEMMEILHGLGDETHSITAAMKQFGTDEKYQFEDSAAGRQQILDGYKTIITEISRGMSEAFNRLPIAEVEVIAVPAFREKTAAGGYYQAPSLNGSRPGRFFVNLYDIKATTKFGMRTLAYHEAVPGHHFQIAIAQELEGLPTFRSVLGFTSFVEGWALYAEQLAWELGYQSDPLNNLGRLSSEKFRAVRLVVDTGIHHKRWTREQAIAYMSANTDMADSEVVSEIERYIANPGQALAYKVGMLKILELRKKARSSLGERFDLREFHDAVLAHGPMPLTILEELIDEYITAASS
jgi:uncharacterized protein (DUF885 family)